MKNDRRNFIKHTTMLGIGGMAISPINLASASKEENMKPTLDKRPKVLFFDVNETLLDLRPLQESVGKVLNGKKDLLPMWFTTMLHYSLVSTVGRQYNDFGKIGAATLQMVAANNDITITEKEAKEAVIGPIRSLPTHPEVKKALQQLKDDGYKMASFTNSSNEGVKTQFENAGLLDYFEERISVEDIGKFKPHVDTYDWAARKMGVQPSECLLVAAHGWDVAGALWAGWKGAFVSRPGKQLYPLAPKPEINESDLALVANKLVAIDR